MTNEQAKQEAIKKAFEKCGVELGEHFPKYNNFSRFISVQKPELCDILDERELLGYCRIRPKSLKGIDSNNGWTRIEPDGSNLPEDDRVLNSSFIVFDIMDREEEDMSCLMKASANGVIQLFNQRRITHYKPIKEELKPIY